MPKTLNRRNAMAAFAVAALAVTTACGSSGNDTKESSSPSAGAKHTVTTAMGEVQVPGSPQRVVVLDTDALDSAVTLGITPVGAVLHDLNQAARYADHLVAMKAGRVIAQGAPRDIVTADLVHEVFGLASVVVPDPVTGDPLVVPGAPWRPDGHRDSGDSAKGPAAVPAD